jgi:hypothetical protein
MKKKCTNTLNGLYARPVSGSIKWKDIEALFIELFGEVRVFHRPHPGPDTDK